MLIISINFSKHLKTKRINTQREKKLKETITGQIKVKVSGVRVNAYMWWKKKRSTCQKTQIREVKDRGYSTTGQFQGRQRIDGGVEGVFVWQFFVMLGIQRSFQIYPVPAAVGHRRQVKGMKYKGVIVTWTINTNIILQGLFLCVDFFPYLICR